MFIKCHVLWKFNNNNRIFTGKLSLLTKVDHCENLNEIPRWKFQQLTGWKTVHYLQVKDTSNKLPVWWTPLIFTQVWNIKPLQTGFTSKNIQNKVCTSRNVLFVQNKLGSHKAFLQEVHTQDLILSVLVYISSILPPKCMEILSLSSMC